MVWPEVALVQIWTSASTQTILVLLGTSFTVTLNEGRLMKQLDEVQLKVEAIFLKKKAQSYKLGYSYD